MQPRAARRNAGFSLTELLIAMVMLSIITVAAVSLFQSQSVSFRRGTERFEMVQNARNSMEMTERIIRTMGAGVAGQQPILVYGNNNTLAFNTDYVEQDTVSMRWATYFNPDVSAIESQAWLVGSAAVVPGSSPSYTYPSATYLMGNGTTSPAETYLLYFQADGSTTRSDDYILYQRVNNGTAEVLSRNVLAATGSVPFFQYLMQRILGTGDTLITASGSLLPLARRPLTGYTPAPGNATDSANYVRPDSVRAIRISFRVTNGKTGTDERIREVSTLVETPNNGIPMPTVCGRPPLPSGTLVLTNTGAAGSGRVNVAWTRSTDQDGGEVDVRQYIIWRRLASASVWADPLLVIGAVASQTSYTTTIQDNLPGTAYTFGIAAQDCTPNLSSFVTANITTTSTPP